MARQPVETCMFCMPDPCSCNQKKPAKQAGLKPARKQAIVDVQLPEEPKKRTGIVALAKTSTQEEDREYKEYRRALTVLAQSEILWSGDIDKHRKDLNLSSTEIDVLIWKQRRAEWLARERRGKQRGAS